MALLYVRLCLLELSFSPSTISRSWGLAIFNWSNPTQVSHSISSRHEWIHLNEIQLQKTTYFAWKSVFILFTFSPGKTFLEHYPHQTFSLKDRAGAFTFCSKTLLLLQLQKPGTFFYHRHNSDNWAQIINKHSGHCRSINPEHSLSSVPKQQFFCVWMWGNPCLS